MLALLFLAFSVFANDDKDDKSRTFEESYERIWAACVASANENFVIEHTDKDSGILTFHTGKSFTSGGFQVGVTIKTAENKTNVQLNTQAKALGNWGAGGRIAKKFFKGVERYLKEGKAKV